VAEQIAYEQVSSMIAAIAFVMFAILVARLIQEEPLVSLDWFWLTRPYDRRALAGAKLLFAATFFVVLPLIGELAVMAAFKAGPVDSDRTPSVSMAVLAAVTDEELVRYGTQPGRVSATLHFTLTPSRVIGTLPLAARGSLRESSMRAERAQRAAAYRWLRRDRASLGRDVHFVAARVPFLRTRPPQCGPPGSVHGQHAGFTARRGQRILSDEYVDGADKAALQRSACAGQFPGAMAGPAAAGD
jgi:hypothetical protein